MKVRQIKKEEEKKFKPITLEMTFETEEEAIEFWHRMNVIGFNDYANSRQMKYRKGIEKGHLRRTGMARACYCMINDALAEQGIDI